MQVVRPDRSPCSKRLLAQHLCHRLVRQCHVQSNDSPRKTLRALRQILFFILHSSFCIQKYSGSLPGFHLMLQPMLGF